MNAPNAETLERYKNNLLGGHLLEKGCENARDYWLNLAASCDKDCDGRPDAKHLQELAKIEYIEAVIGVCRLGIMQKEMTAPPKKKDLFTVSKTQIVAAGVTLAGVIGWAYIAMNKKATAA